MPISLKFLLRYFYVRASKLNVFNWLPPSALIIKKKAMDFLGQFDCQNTLRSLQPLNVCRVPATGYAVTTVTFIKKDHIIVENRSSYRPNNVKLYSVMFGNAASLNNVWIIDILFCFVPHVHSGGSGYQSPHYKKKHKHTLLQRLNGISMLNWIEFDFCWRCNWLLLIII